MKYSIKLIASELHLSEGSVSTSEHKIPPFKSYYGINPLLLGFNIAEVSQKILLGWLLDAWHCFCVKIGESVIGIELFSLNSGLTISVLK